MAFTLKDIDHFLAVAKVGHRAHLAQALDLTPSALTKSIHRVEFAFGLALFERNARGAHLTQAGLRFLEVAQRLSTSYADATRVMAQMRDRRSGFIRIGFSSAAQALQMSGTIAGLLDAHPGLKLSCRIELPHPLIVQGIRNGELDMGVTSSIASVPAGVRNTALGRDPLLPIVRSDHPLAPRQTLTLSDLQPYRWALASSSSAVGDALNALFESENLSPPVVAIQSDQASEFALLLARHANLITLASRSLWNAASREGLCTLTVPQLRIVPSIRLLTRSGAHWTPLAKTFRDALAAGAQSMLAADN